MRKLSPVFKARVWGGDYIARHMLGAPGNEPIGEAWLVSDHPSGPTLDDRGRTLGELAPRRPWFPVMIKLLHAQADLSVQVHPNDEQAKAVHDLGKAEGWLILSAEPGARICHGHRAEDAAQLRDALHSGDARRLLRYTEVQPGEYYPVPPGTVHALGAGIVALEVQESSDTTYRLYDYDRPGQDGKPRDLHIEQGLAVTAFPQPRSAAHKLSVRVGQEALCEANEYFRFSVLEVDGGATVVAGRGEAVCLISLADGVGPGGGSAGARQEPRAFDAFVLEPGEAASVGGSGPLALIRVALGEQ